MSLFSGQSLFGFQYSMFPVCTQEYAVYNVARAVSKQRCGPFAHKEKMRTDAGSIPHLSAQKVS